MTAVSGTNRKVIVVVIVVTLSMICLAAIAIVGLEPRHKSGDALQLESLVIEAGSYYPHIWINSSDPSLNVMNHCSVDLYFMNESSGERSLLFGTGGSFRPFEGSWCLEQDIDLQSLSPGNYSVVAFVNCSFYPGGSSDTDPIPGRINGSVSLPSDRPLLPGIVFVEFRYEADHDSWHYVVVLNDPDEDVDRVQFYAYNGTTPCFNTGWINNTDSHLYWTIEGYTKSSAPFNYWGVIAEDHDGPHVGVDYPSVYLAPPDKELNPTKP